MPFSTIPIKRCSSVAKRDHHNCTAKEFEECLDALSAITQTEDLALAATREELNLVCRKLQHGVRCIDDHSFRCFTAGQKRIFNSVVSESRHVINDLCVPGKLQEDYLRYAPCLKNVSTDDRKCALQYKRLASSYEDSGRDVNDKLKIHCCVFTEFVQCQHEHLLRDCGTAAEQFFQRHMDRMSGSLINEHCALYTHGSNACAFDTNSVASLMNQTKGTPTTKKEKKLQVPGATNPFQRNAKYKGFSLSTIPLSLRIRLIKAEVKRHFKLRWGEVNSIEENPSMYFEGKQPGLISNSVCLCLQLSSQFPEFKSAVC
ncbi:uncharacterized protein CDAR_500411 [Caerostris darwini]|uniref:Uncharacterized protein n=1 Tax=Caerostris darwini TaxID=1538125 RepID=A0AAV4M8Q6_9ARAC|nr:uncharacterized protein CDAR_500411 [Caerostris darwini]